MLLIYTYVAVVFVLEYKISVFLIALYVLICYLMVYGVFVVICFVSFILL